MFQIVHLHVDFFKKAAIRGTHVAIMSGIGLGIGSAICFNIFKHLFWGRKQNLVSLPQSPDPSGDIDGVEDGDDGDDDDDKSEKSKRTDGSKCQAIIDDDLNELSVIVVCPCVTSSSQPKSSSSSSSDKTSSSSSLLTLTIPSSSTPVISLSLPADMTSSSGFSALHYSSSPSVSRVVLDAEVSEIRLKSLPQLRIIEEEECNKDEDGDSDLLRMRDDCVVLVIHKKQNPTDPTTPDPNNESSKSNRSDEGIICDLGDCDEDNLCERGIFEHRRSLTFSDYLTSIINQPNSQFHRFSLPEETFLLECRKFRSDKDSLMPDVPGYHRRVMNSTMMVEEKCSGDDGGSVDDRIFFSAGCVCGDEEENDRKSESKGNESSNSGVFENVVSRKISGLNVSSSSVPLLPATRGSSASSSFYDGSYLLTSSDQLSIFGEDRISNEPLFSSGSEVAVRIADIETKLRVVEMDAVDMQMMIERMRGHKRSETSIPIEFSFSSLSSYPPHPSSHSHVTPSRSLIHENTSTPDIHNRHEVTSIESVTDDPLLALSRSPISDLNPHLLHLNDTENFLEWNFEEAFGESEDLF